MKKFTKMLAAAAAGIAMAGCTSINTSDGASGIPQPAPKAGDYQAVYTQKDVRVSGKGHANVLFWIFAWGADGFADNSALSSFSFLPSPSNYAKSAAVYNTCKTNKADILLGTKYTITTTDYFFYKTVDCEVSGYPAVMTGVKKLDPYLIKAGEKIVYLDQAPLKK